MAEKVFNVLFLYTGNSARSILGEALLNHLGKGRFKAFSAGSHPGGKVNPFALELLEKNGIATTGLRSKSWSEFEGPVAPKLDFVFTVCDSAAKETCPIWPGHPVNAHWGIADPAAVQGSDEEKRRAFRDAYAILQRRISLLASLPLGSLDRAALKKQLDDIGKPSLRSTVDAKK
jgi:arsenate reductase